MVPVIGQLATEPSEDVPAGERRRDAFLVDRVENLRGRVPVVGQQAKQPNRPSFTACEEGGEPSDARMQPLGQER